MEGDRCFVGIDLGGEHHQAVVIDQAGTVLGEKAVTHSGASLSELCGWLSRVGASDPSAICVALEAPRGAVVETLLGAGFAVFSLNPKQLDRFRDRFTVAGAKDDRLDARVLADSLRTDQRLFRRLEPDDPIVIELREWSRLVEELGEQRRRLGNRIRDQLYRYFPQMLELDSDPSAPWMLDLWQLVPTPQKARSVRQSAVASVLRRNRIRKLEAPRVLEVLRQPALRVGVGTEQAATAHIRVLVAQLRVIHEQLEVGDHTLHALCRKLSERDGEIGEQRDVEILQSLPGVGRIVLTTLLAEAWQPLRARDYRALRSLSGIAPVTKKSGKRRYSVVMRRACHQRLRFALYHWARVAVQKDERSRRAYRALRERGATHGHAMRAVADRLLKMACAMLRDRTMYDPSRRKVTLAA